MTDVALLNPQLDLAAAAHQIQLLQTFLRHEESKLTHTLLDREVYLQVYGATVALRTAHQALLEDYNLRINL